MTKISFNWQYSKNTEAERIIWTYYQIVNRFYLHKKWFVLPYPVSKNPRTIYFPKLNYSNIKNFSKKTINFYSKETDKDLISEVSKLIGDANLNFHKLQKTWDMHANNFLENIDQLIPNILSHINEIEIRPTRYGTLSSGINKKNKVVVYIRQDQDISHIAEGILIVLLDRDLESSEFLWEEKEAIIDFLFLKTKLKRLFPKYTATLKLIRQKQQAKLFHDSLTYLKSFGVTDKRILQVINEGVYLNDRLIHLTKTEAKVVSQMILNEGKVVTFDEIADIIWGDDSDEKFSLYALTKTIERIRKKIEIQGMHSQIIQTKKGEGYMIP